MILEFQRKFVDSCPMCNPSKLFPLLLCIIQRNIKNEFQKHPIKEMIRYSYLVIIYKKKKKLLEK